MDDKPNRDLNGRFVKGCKHSKEAIEKMRLAKLDPRPWQSNEKNGMWKGDNVKYRALHMWINKYLPKPKLCEFCHLRPPFDLANLTGIYNREFKNWKYLCRKCHKQYDKTYPKLKREVNYPQLQSPINLLKAALTVISCE